MENNQLTRTIIGQAIDLHKTIGPKHNDAHYARKLATRLRDHDLATRLNVNAWVNTGQGDEERWERVGTLHLVVEDLVGVLIAVRKTAPGDRQRQTLKRMLEARRLPIGLILNFTPFKVEIGRVNNRQPR